MSPRPLVDPHRYDATCECRACLELFIRRQRSLYGEQDPLAAAKGIFNALAAALVTAGVVVVLLLAAGVVRWPW